MAETVIIPQEAADVMALIWNEVAGFLNERKTGSVTFNFVNGKMTARDLKDSKRF